MPSPEFLQQLTDEIALAVDNTLHEEGLRREHGGLRMLLEINNALVANFEPPALFEEIAGRLRTVVELTSRLF
jgi:predicted component of type VI protein secretion system